MSANGSEPDHLHLTTPASRLFSLSVAMLANLPMWAMLLLVLTVTRQPDEVLATGMCLFPVAWVVNAAASGFGATLLGQIGGNLAILPGAATLDGRRIAALHDWDAQRGWLAVQTEATEVPQYRFGTRRDIRKALAQLQEQIPTTTTEEDRLDGFQITCRPGRPHVDLDFAILWSTGLNMLGAVPFAGMSLALQPTLGTVFLLGLFGVAAFLVALVLTSLGGWAVQAGQRRPEVRIILRGRTLEIIRRGRTDRTQIDDPARQIQIEARADSLALNVHDPHGRRVCEAFLTRPAADALQQRLAPLEPTESGTEAEVPVILGRLRAPDGPATG